MATVDTTELRWFADGSLPDHVIGWFTRNGAAGNREQRTDTYRIDDYEDVGVKRRFQDTLEFKTRRAVGSLFVLHDGLVAPLEEWRRYSPADGLVETGVDDEWIDVHKLVYKRRFSADGKEIVWFNGAPPDIAAGCDVEVAGVSVGDLEAWTFAVAAFGLADRHEDALSVAWDSLVADNPCPAGFGAMFDQTCGYPTWLSQWESSGALKPTGELGRQLVA